MAGGFSLVLVQSELFEVWRGGVIRLGRQRMLEIRAWGRRVPLRLD